MTLDSLHVGESARILSVSGDGALRRHFLDMGLTPDTVVTLIKKAPMGDPLEIFVRGYELTLRKEDAALIACEEAAAPKIGPASAPHRMIQHPHVGELETHRPGDKPLIPETTPIVFALAGNQNCGKTTLFNQLTGSNQHVGNFPGVTVDSKSGRIRGHEDATVVDLPGIYSLSPYTNEEIVTRDFILKGRPDGIINIVDATNIERNLYLTMQLIELDVPIVIALNMMDEVRDNGGTIDINQLEESLGVAVVPISASKNEGVEELVKHAIHVARFKESPGLKDFCPAEGEPRDVAIHRSLHAIMHLIQDHAERAGIPVRFAASKLIEGDEPIMKSLSLDGNEKETLEHILVQLEAESGTDRDAALADARFRFIERVCRDSVVKPHESRERLRSLKADRILTGKYTAIPAFIVIMAMVFYLTFGPVGTFLSDLLSLGIDKLTSACDALLSAYGLNPIVHSLIIDGVFAGVGSVLSFLPIIVVLFFFLSLLLLNLGLDTVEIAIGNNLLIYPWIKKLVRVNKSFIVERGLSPRQQLESSARMSRYIHCTVAQRGQSIWIAQREGRAKDSNDHTQESVLKMLALGGEGEPAQRLAELNIVPLSLSYEYDPCDYLKAREFQLKRDVEGYKKTTQDDLENMATGIFGYKGKVHFHLGKPVNDELHALPKPCNKQAFFAHAAACIDRQIYANYRLYPGNYVAYDWLNRTRRFADRYTPEEKQTFERYIEGQLAKIELPCRDDGFLRERLLEMYANPLVNHLSTQP